MEQAVPKTNFAGEDGYSQFFIEAAVDESHAQSALSDDAQEMLANLLNAYSRLRAASYRIGYLEGRLLKYRRLSTAVVAQSAKSRTGNSMQGSSAQLPTQTSARPRSDTNEYPSVHEDDHSPWWLALADGMAGSDRGRGMGKARGKRISRNNYYDLIRRSVSR